MVDFPTYGDQPGLFDEVEAQGPVTAEVLRALIGHGHKGRRTDPRNALPFPEGIRDEFMDQVVYWGRGAGDEVEIEGLGKFVFLHTWGEHRDGAEMGFVLKDLNTTHEYLFTSTYSSWDVEDWEVDRAESYTFTETRWKKVRG